MSLKLFVLGLIGLAVSVKFAGGVLTALFESTWRFWEGVVGTDG